MARQQYPELFPANPGNKTAPAVLLKLVCNELENSVSCIMTVRIINRLEMINVADRQHKLTTVCECFAGFMLKLSHSSVRDVRLTA